MRRLDARPWRMIQRFVVMDDGRVLYVLSCSHERLDPPAFECDLTQRTVRCVSCPPGVEAITPIEHMPGA